MDPDHLDLSHEIDRVSRSLSSLEDRVHRAESSLRDLEDVPERLDHLETDVRRANDDVEEVRRTLDDRIEAVDDRVSDTDSEVDKAQTRIAALERHVRQAQGAVVVDLDHDPDGRLHELAQTAARGRSAATHLMPPHEQTRLQRLCDELPDLWSQREKHRKAAIRSATQITETDTGTPERTQAEEAFTVALGKARSTDKQVTSLKPQVEDAREKLRRQTALRTQHGAAVSAGDEADDELRDRLHERLSNALEGTELLPEWFCTALGPAPPGAHSHAWMEDAVDLMAARATYQITHTALPLGSDPDAIEDETWKKRLYRALKRWG